MNKTLHYALIGAVLMTDASAAEAQNKPLDANIPFAFRAFGSELPAGQYRVRPLGTGSPVLEIRNAETGHAVYVLGKDGPPIGSAWPSSAEHPYLTFQCRGEDCDLDSLVSGARSAARFGPVRFGNSRKSTQTIRLTPTQKK